MSTNNMKFDIIETEAHHGYPNDTLWKYTKLEEILTDDLKKWSKSNQNDRTLIFTKNDETTRFLVCEIYAQLKVQSTIFLLSAHVDTTESDDEDNQKVMNSFKIGKNLLAVSTFDVHEHVQFDFVKHLIFIDIPDGAIFSQTVNFFGKKAKDCLTNGKITVFESGMSEKQKVYLIEILQKTGQPIPNFLLQFVIDNATIPMPVAATSSVFNGNSPVTSAPTPPTPPTLSTLQPLSISTKAIATSKSSKSTTNNKNCSQFSVMMDGTKRQVRTKWLATNQEYNDEFYLSLLATEMSLGKCDFKCTSSDYSRFHQLSKKEKEALNERFDDYVWDEVIFRNGIRNEIRHYKNEKKQSTVQEIMEDINDQLDMQNEEPKNELNYVMIVLHGEIHILKTTNYKLDNKCKFCSAHNHQSHHCVFYPTYETRKLRCAQVGICDQCGCVPRYRQHRCPEPLLCRTCHMNGHIEALGHDHPDW